MNNMLGLVLVKIVHPPAKKGIAYGSCNMKVPWAQIIMNNMLGLVLVKIVHPAKKGIAYSSCNMKVTMITVKGATFLKN